MEASKDLTVALLLADLQDARELSLVFRKTGVVPFIYESLREFWRGALERVPTLSVVDVRMMNEGELLLKNHPSIKNEEMPLVFFYEEGTLPLLLSTYDLFHLGHLRKGEHYPGQIKSILKRLNKLLFYELTTYDLRIDQKKYEEQIQSLVTGTEKIKEEYYYRKQSQSFCDLIEKYKNQYDDFFQACAQVFIESEMVREFSWLELSINGQKLVAPGVKHQKFRPIPPLWTGRPCPHGIEFFAQSMANQVVIELMGSEVMIFQLRGAYENPDLMIFISVTQVEYLELIDWNYLESYLEGTYCWYKLKTNESYLEQAQFLQPWQLLSKLDQYFFDVKFNAEDVEDLAVVGIGFTRFWQIIRSQSMIRFYWANFYETFCRKLQAQFPGDYRISAMGVQELLLVGEKSYLENIYPEIVLMAQKFPYWKYFEDLESVLALDLKPNVRMIPLSSDALLGVLEQDLLKVTTNKLREKREMREHEV